MRNLIRIIKLTVGLTLMFFVSNLAFGETKQGFTNLLDELRSVDAAEVASVERELIFLWSKTGSASADLILKRAEADMAQQKFHDAADRFATLCELAPDHAASHLGYAQALYALGYIGPAIAELEVALRIETQFYPALYTLAQIYEALDRKELAFRTYQAVHEIHPRLANLDKALQRLSASVKGQSL